MNVHERFGVVPVINATGSVTRLGGALVPEAVLQAMAEAAAHAASLEEWQAAASRCIARHTGAEAGLVTAGCSAGLFLGTAAILAGLDRGRMEQLPALRSDRREFVVAREQRNGYDHAVRAAGATLVEVGFNEIVAHAGVRRTETWEYEAEFTERTAGVLYVAAPHAQPPLAELVAAAHRHGIPVLVDAAGEVLPRQRLPDLVASGADLVACSGGKALRGPQSSGLLCGRRELIFSAALQLLDMDDHPVLWSPPVDWAPPGWSGGPPRHGLGRLAKVSKEEIAGVLTALDLFYGGHYQRERGDQLRRLAEVARAIPAPATARLLDPSDGESFPTLEVHVGGRDAYAICRRLRAGQPRVFVGHGQLAEGVLVVHPLCLKDAEVPALCQRLREELSA